MIELPPGLSVVVPAYNSTGALPELVARLEAVLPALAPGFEVIIVNDGGGDATWTMVAQICHSHRFVRGICLMRNYGQHNALLCGIRAARFDTVVTIDDDLQNPPEEICHLLAALTNGLEVVYGPPLHAQHGLLRNVSSMITKLALQSVMGAQTARSVSAFRVFRTRLRESFATYHSPFVNIDVLLTWGTARFGAVPVRHDARKAGVSNYTVGKLMRHALNMLTGFSVVPLRLASIVGFTFTLFGFGILLYVVGRYFISGSDVPGFPFLASVIAIFSGAQLFALGIIGEYLAGIHFRTMDKPTYAIRDVIATAV
jgi:glycosyltransferase involved in cell wall biosynthesis